METIGQAIRNKLAKGPTTHLPSCDNSGRKAKLPAKWGTIEDFATAHNPDTQLSICKDADECWFGQYPTLARLDSEYGRNSASYWLVPELANLSEFCGCREKLTGPQLKECAVIIAQQYYYLKTSELMLFFYRFKAGRYGRFYGSVDPLVIMQALREFARERNEAYDRHEGEVRRRRHEAERSRAVSYAEYKRLRAKATRPMGHNTQTERSTP